MNTIALIPTRRTNAHANARIGVSAMITGQCGCYVGRAPSDIWDHLNVQRLAEAGVHTVQPETMPHLLNIMSRLHPGLTFVGTEPWVADLPERPPHPSEYMLLVTTTSPKQPKLRIHMRLLVCDGAKIIADATPAFAGHRASGTQTVCDYRMLSVPSVGYRRLMWQQLCRMAREVGHTLHVRGDLSMDVDADAGEGHQ